MKRTVNIIAEKLVTTLCLIFHSSQVKLKKSKFSQATDLVVCSYDVTYALESKFTLYSCLNIKELLSASGRGKISVLFIFIFVQNYAELNRFLNSNFFLCCSCSCYRFKVFKDFDVCILLQLRIEITVILNRVFHDPSNRLDLLQKNVVIYLFSEYFKGFPHKTGVIFAKKICYFPSNFMRREDVPRGPK